MPRHLPNQIGTPSPRSTRLVAWLLGLFATIGFLGGLPMLLLAAPSPFDADRGLGSLARAVVRGTQVFDEAVISLVVAVGWCAWAYLLIAALVELTAALRGGVTTVKGLGAGRLIVRPVVAALMWSTTATTLSLSTIGGGAVALVAPPPAAAQQLPMNVADDDVDREGTDVVVARLATGELVVDGTPAVAHVVDGSETMWDMAASHLGDSMRWREIAQLNPELEQEEVEPGSVVYLPADATNVTVNAPTKHTVVEGESLWTIAEDQLEGDQSRVHDDPQALAQYWDEVVQANEGRLPSGDANLIFPGDLVVLPGTGSSEVEVSRSNDPEPRGSGETTFDAGSEAKTLGNDSAAYALQMVDIDLRASLPDLAESMNSDGVPEASLPVERPPQADVVRADRVQTDALTQPDVSKLVDGSSARPAVTEEASRPLIGVVSFTAGSALLAAGITQALRRRRNLQRRVRPSGELYPPVSEHAAAFERALQHAAESERVRNWQVVPTELVDALRLAPEADADLGPLVVRPFDASAKPGSNSDNSHEALSSVEAAEPIVPSSAVVTPSGAGHCVATLVVGTSTSDEPILIELPAGGSTVIEGCDTDLNRFAEHAVLDLATADRLEDVAVIAVGPHPRFTELARVHAVPNFAEACELSRRLAERLELADGQRTPIVVVSVQEPTSDERQELAEAGCHLIAPDSAGESVVGLDGDIVHLRGHDDVATTAAFTIPELGYADELVCATSPTVATRPAQVSANDNGHVQPGSGESAGQQSPQVQILGPVNIAGAEPFSSLKAIDVITYLAFHPNGADADQLKTWIWPADEPPTDKAFANVMSRARMGLGSGANGEPYLSRAGASRVYRLSADVSTDYHDFCTQIESARQHGGAEKRRGLKTAIELVRGIPFTGGSATCFGWADHHIRSEVEFAIDEAVHSLVDEALEASDLAMARWATSRGLELMPGCEQCFRGRFRTAESAGNRTELRRAMADLERVSSADLGEVEGSDFVSPDLVELYHELERRLASAS